MSDTYVHPGQRRLSIRDILALTSVTDCQLRPDGAALAYVVTDTSRTTAHARAGIWLADLSTGGAPTPLVVTDCHNAAPRWSPDGARLAFLSDRAQRGVREVYGMSVADGREITRCTEFGRDVSGISWSPDGRSLACIIERANQAAPKRGDPGAADAQVYDGDMHWHEVMVIDMTASTIRHEPMMPFVNNWHVLDLDWSPDGEAMVMAATTTPRIDEAFQAVQLMKVVLRGGDPTRLATLTGTNPEPRWSPDGKWIAFKSGKGASYLSLALCVVPERGGTVRDLTESFEGCVHAYRWLPDSTAVIAAAQHGLTSSVQQIDVQTARPEPWTDEAFTTGGIEQTVLSLAHDGSTFALIREYDHEPRAVWTGAPGQVMQCRTPLPPVTGTLRLGVVRTVTWKAHDGEQIEGAVVLPPDYEPGRRYPLVVQVHGGPASLCQRKYQVAWNEWGQLLAAEGYIVLRPNPRGSSGYGMRFVTANRRDLGGGDYRDIIAGVDHLINEGLADLHRTAIGGWSYGGYMSAWAVTQTDRFRCAVVGAPITNMLSFTGTTDIPKGFLPTYYMQDDPYRSPEIYHQQSPLFGIHNVTAPVLLLHGEQDVRVPISQSIEFYTALRCANKHVEFMSYPREGHSIAEPEHQRDVMERVRDWYRSYLL